MSHRTILLQPAAPAKPAPGAACNGCGVCCAWQPCPVGMLVSGRTTGPCRALRWSDASGLYRCGLLARPRAHLPAGLRWLAPALARMARRWIAAGIGCDSSLVVDPPPAAG